MTAMQFLDPDSNIMKWVLRYSVPVVVLATSSWRKSADCEVMTQIIEDLSRNPRYSSVRFFCFDPDENGQAFNELLIKDTPCVVIFQNGKEIVRFSTITSRPGIIHHLDSFLDPAKNNPATSLVPRGLISGTPTEFGSLGS